MRAEGVEVFSAVQRVSPQRAPVQLGYVQNGGQIDEVEYLDERLRTDRLDAEWMENVVGKVAKVAGDNELRFVVHGQRDDMAVALVGKRKALRGAGVALAPCKGEVRAHLREQMRALALCEAGVFVEGAKELGNDLVGPQRLEAPPRGEVEEEVPELKRE
jgi:hypothetical protein